MKKATTILMLAASTGLASCTAQSPKANMKNDVDTLSYMMGISNTQGLKEYAMNQLGIDSAHFADFVKGIEQGTKSTDPKNVAYTAGMQIGHDQNDQPSAVRQRLYSVSEQGKLPRRILCCTG